MQDWVVRSCVSALARQVAGMLTECQDEGSPMFWPQVAVHSRFLCHCCSRLERCRERFFPDQVLQVWSRPFCNRRDSIMSSGGQYEWAEEDFYPPPGAYRMELSGPVDGKTYVMYHGTTSCNANKIQRSGFRQSCDGMLGRGVYLSRELEKASRYPIGHPEYDRVVIKVLVKVGRVKCIDYKNHPLQKTWHNHGYDTAWVPPNCGMVPSGLEENCVWDPARIQIIGTIRPQLIRAASGWMY
uniref:PARP catalytic domain-containing protein n=2 Tax=Salarias fasciatus TaxID=181472 RepID=A0A672FMZ2_SALFA